MVTLTSSHLLEVVIMTDLPRSAADLLESAAAIVDDGWTLGALARDAHGEAVDPLDAAARSFRVDGALVRAMRTSQHRLIDEATIVLEAVVAGNVIAWNDSQTDSAVVAAAVRYAAMVLRARAPFPITLRGRL